MRWITRENIRVDRVACPGLIKRFVDSEAARGICSHPMARAPLCHPALKSLFVTEDKSYSNVEEPRRI